MDKKLLVKNLYQLRDIRKEIKKLEKKINRTKSINNLTDVVESSSKFFPYTKQHIKLLGENVEVSSKLDYYRDVLEKRLLNLLEIQTEVEIFISKIPTSRIRQIIEMKYLQECSWQKIATELGGNTTPESARKEHDRYLKQIK